MTFKGRGTITVFPRTQGFEDWLRFDHGPFPHRCTPCLSCLVCCVCGAEHCQATDTGKHVNPTTVGRSDRHDPVWEQINGRKAPR